MPAHPRTNVFKAMPTKRAGIVSQFGIRRDRQLTNGRRIRLELPDGPPLETRALGVDARSGGLVIEDPAAPGGERTILTGEIHHLRLPSSPTPTARSAPRPELPAVEV